jgi:drug/metabolite transporter (DMT)-like permease
MLEIPIFGAVTLASGILLEKIVLKHKKINIELYQTAHFVAIVAAMLPFIYFFWNVSSQFFTKTNIFIFILVVIFSIIANMLTFYSMKWEKITNLEPAKMLEPLFTILLAITMSFFFSALYERNFGVIIPALIASAALIFSHFKKHHLEFNKYFIAAIFGSLFFAMELITSRLILDYFNPITFYFFRCVGILGVSFFIFRHDFSNIDFGTRWQILFTGILWFLYRIVIYYGYTNLGVVFTTLMLMLGPIFVYLFAHIFLKEKLSLRNVIAALIILGCVVYAVVV